MGAIQSINVPNWIVNVGQGNNDSLFGIAVDSSDNVVATGYFHGDVDFGGELLSSMQKDIFAAKYDSDGTLVWTRKMGGPGIDEGRAIAVDGSDNIYVSGNFRQTATFGSDSEDSNGGDDIFISKLDSGGTFQWSWSAGGPFVDSGWGVAADTSQNVYATGYFSGSVAFDPAPSNTFTSTNNTNDVFVVALNSDGSFKWANYVAGNSGDRGNDIAVDSSRGFVYVTGFIQSDSNFDPNGSGFLVDPAARDIFLAKYDAATGAHIDTIILGELGNRDFGSGLVVDESSGFIYLTGAFDGTTDFNPASGNAHIGLGRSDAFVAVYDADLSYQWSAAFGGEGEVVGEAIALGRNDGGVVTNVYISGWFTDMADFDPDPANVFERTSNGGADMFVLSLSSTGDFVSVATIGSPDNDESLAIGSDNSNLIYGGFFGGTLDADPTDAVNEITAAGGEEILLSSLSGNVAPIANAQNVSLDEDTPIDISLTGLDPAGDSITFGIGNQPANGVLGAITPTGDTSANVTYTPNLNYSGQDSFTFNVSDSSGISNTATVSIEILPINDAPVADKTFIFTANEDEMLEVPAPGLLGGTTSDPDAGDSLTSNSNLQASQLGAGLSVAADGSFQYDPLANAEFQKLKAAEIITDSFDFAITDGSGAADTATALVRLEGRNDPPVAVDDSGFSTPENTALSATTSILGNDSDIDQDVLQVEQTPVAGPSSGTVVLNQDGTFVYTPNTGFSGDDTFRYRAIDNNGGQSEANVFITVGSVNSRPVTADSSAEVNEDEVLNGPNLLAQASDPENNQLSLEQVPIIAPNHGNLLLNADGTYQYTPNANFNGADSFAYRVCDNGTPVACSENATVSITVLPVNDPPAVQNDQAAVLANSTSSIVNVLENDSPGPDGDDALTVIDVSQPDQGGMTSLNADGQIVYTPAAGFVGTETFTYVVSDKGNAQATGTVTVTVSDSPQPPVGEGQDEIIFLPVR